MYYLVKVTSDNMVSLIPCKDKGITLLVLKKEVGGYIELVRLPRLPDLAMIVNENGYMLHLPFNAVGSGLYGSTDHAVLGDIILGSFYNPDPEVESDVYAFDSITALKIKGMVHSLLKEYKKAGLI